MPVKKLRQRVNELHEFNPVLGLRGCRLGLVYSEISEMQARAVFEAAAEVQKAGIKVKPSSFGTNDLTPTALGMSRDDSGSFIASYTEAEIIKQNPLASIDQAAVGQLMKIAVEKGRQTRPDLKPGPAGAGLRSTPPRRISTPVDFDVAIPGGRVL